MKELMTDTLVLREDSEGLGVHVGNRDEIADDGSWPSRMYLTYDLAQTVIELRETS